jgi:hypothetical protein
VNGTAEQRIVGAWRLVSFTQEGADGVVLPFGNRPLGWILYTPEGRMAAQIARAELPRPADRALIASLTADEAQAILAAFVAYGGSWDVDEARGCVVHRVDISSQPNMIGSELVRQYRFEGDRLLLRPPPRVVDGVERQSEVVWRRVADRSERKPGARRSC